MKHEETGTMTLYTWDYTALVGLPSKKVDPKLLTLGFALKVETDPPKPVYPRTVRTSPRRSSRTRSPTRGVPGSRQSRLPGRSSARTPAGGP